MTQKTIQEFLSEIRTTERARFDFLIPDTVEADLTACYRLLIECFGCTFSPAPDTLRVLKSAARWLQNGKPGLLLTGTVGTGKSKLLMAIRALITYYTGGYSDMKIFSAPAICELPLSKNEDGLTTLARLKTYRYLGIDDLGTEPVTVKSWGTELSPVIDALYARYDKRMMTVITTNDDLKNIKSKYGDRIYDRLCEQYDRITFNFKSFRQT
jgi:DNA replication protein DnaC